MSHDQVGVASSAVAAGTWQRRAAGTQGQADMQADKQTENRDSVRELGKTVGEPVGGTQSDRQRS